MKEWWSEGRAGSIVRDGHANWRLAGLALTMLLPHPAGSTTGSELGKLCLTPGWQPTPASGSRCCKAGYRQRWRSRMRCLRVISAWLLHAFWLACAASDCPGCGCRAPIPPSLHAAMAGVSSGAWHVPAQELKLDRTRMRAIFDSPVDQIAQASSG